MFSNILRAHCFAELKHDGQMYGKYPYIFHCDMVAVFVEKYLGAYATEDVIVAGVLHDLIEDTSTTREEIADHFGDRVAELVWLLTNKVDKEYTYNLIRTDVYATGIKLCDRWANVKSGEKNDKYRKEHALFRKCLYRPGEYDVLWNLIETRLEWSDTSEG